MASPLKSGVVRHGTAREHAALDGAFSASGTSEYSRHAAHAADMKLPHWTPTPRHKPRPHLELGEKIAEQAMLLGSLYMRLRTERSEDRRTKIRKDIDIKSRFLEKLKQEQREALGHK